MKISNHLRVAALVDLPRSPQAGGHVKCWERLAAAAAQSDLPLDLTVYFSGDAAAETLAPHARIRHLPPVFSSANLKFLPYVPDHTDLAPYHRKLARELAQYDVIHTTDGYFAFSRTAERVSRSHNIPLVTSFHTDTPSYTRLFTHQTIEKLFGGGWLGKKMVEDWQWPMRQQRVMEKKLARHIHHCRYALATTEENHEFADQIIGKENVFHLRLGIDKKMFGPHRRDREGIERDYGVPPNHLIVVFVGRLDIGKNIYTLVAAMEKLLGEGVPLHLIAAGVGPAADDIKQNLGNHVSLPGFVAPDELARIYASADTVALCSEVEIRSMVAVEAMASGLPALISRKSGVAELFNHTPAMRVVDSGIEAWANALRDFALQPDLEKTMHVAALDYSREHLGGWQDVLAEDYLHIWEKAAGRPLSRRAAA